MKKVIMLTLVGLLTFGGTFSTVYATSLDDLVNQTETVVEQPVQQPVVEQPVVEQPVQQPVQQVPQENTSTIPTPYDGSYMETIRDATDLGEASPGAIKINQGIKKVTSFIVQVVSYFVVAGLVVRVVLDLCYVCIPFSRSILANGYAGNAQVGAGGNPGGMQGGMGMNGMGSMGGMGMGMGGMGSMGMGGMGMGGYGRGGYGMGRMGGMGMQGGMQQGQPGASPAMGRTQWVSTAALNAVASEQILGPDGKPNSPLMVYAKDMVPLLVLTPVLFTLAITGVLTDLGFLIGDILVNAISSIGNMI